MQKRSTPGKADSDLLSQLAKATQNSTNGKQAPAGSKAVKDVIDKHKLQATNAYNIRLSDTDTDIIESLVDSLRANGHRRASSADAVRVALRSLSKEALKNPKQFL